MRLFQKRILKRLNNKGLTMVELICAVAIVSILGTCISGFMVVGANSYRSGSAETQVQQEAQLVANQIDDLIIDSTASVTFSGGVLEITQGESQSKVTYDASDKALYYMAYLWDGSVYKEVDTNGAQLMAEGVESFNVVTTDFEKNGNIKLEMQISSGSHVYPAYFTITSRNKALSPEEVSYTKKAKVVTNIRKWLLEPNQDYDFSSHASAIDKNGIARDVTWSIATTGIDADTKFVDNGSGKISKLVIGKNELKSVIRIKASFTEDGETAEKYIDVYIRRVNAIHLQGLLMPTTPVSSQYKMGAEYKLGTAFDGTSLNQVSGAAYDTAPYAYVDTRTVDFTVSSGDASAVEINQSTGMLKLKRDMASGESITIKATSQHAAGVNKSHTAYATVTDEWTITSSIINPPFSWKSSFRRGNDSEVYIAYSDINAFASEKLNISSLPSGSQISWFFRFREKGGEWTKFALTVQQEFTNFKMNASESLFFKIDKDYDVDFAAVIYDSSNKKIYWPMDEDLVNGDGKYNGENVAATGFESYTLDNTYSKKTATAKGEYSATLPIGAAKYFFGQNTSVGLNDAYSASAGSVSAPIVINRGSEIALDMHYDKTVGIAYRMGHSISLDIPNMEYWDAAQGKWIPATDEQKAGVTTQTGNQLKIKNTASTSGIFRAGVYVTGYGYKEYDGTNTVVEQRMKGNAVASGSEFTQGKAYSFTDGTGVITFELPTKPEPTVSISKATNQNSDGKQAYTIKIQNNDVVKIPSGTQLSIVVQASSGVSVTSLRYNNKDYTATSLGGDKYEIIIETPEISANGSAEYQDQYFTLDGTFDKYVQQLTLTTK